MSWSGGFGTKYSTRTVSRFDAHADLEAADCGGDDDSHNRPPGYNLTLIGELD